MGPIAALLDVITHPTPGEIAICAFTGGTVFFFAFFFAVMLVVIFIAHVVGKTLRWCWRTGWLRYQLRTLEDGTCDGLSAKRIAELVEETSRSELQ